MESNRQSGGRAGRQENAHDDKAKMASFRRRSQANMVEDASETLGPDDSKQGSYGRCSFACAENHACVT